MGKIFEFSDIEKSEQVIRKTWSEFREALANKCFTYDDINNARKYTFLKTYDDLFRNHAGINHISMTIKEIYDLTIGRGTILNGTEVPKYERFIPKSEFIKGDNRFSPPGVEWLYLAMGNENDIHKCAQSECRAQKGDRFGFCHFNYDKSRLDLKLVDLTAVDNVSYEKMNSCLEEYGQTELKKGIKIAKVLGYIPKYSVDQKEFKKLFTEWGVYTYTKLLSEQIFEPLQETDDKSIMYAPFQTMAQYYIELGYSGIIYGSTVSDVGRNVVLFDKTIAYPTGKIEDYIIK